jgi:hypothetical protein
MIQTNLARFAVGDMTKSKYSKEAIPNDTAKEI